ncbi:hypothetical protein BLOT_011394 [Blomia tropicalis]|nr:hypothetical protein BLOT_011394 [Blomia tropicalis]
MYYYGQTWSTMFNYDPMMINHGKNISTKITNLKFPSALTNDSFLANQSTYFYCRS